MADVSPLSRVREVSKTVSTGAGNLATSRQPVGRFKPPTAPRWPGIPFTHHGVSTDPNRPARGLDLAHWQQPSSDSRKRQLLRAAL